MNQLESPPPKLPVTVAVTGGAGSGKSTVCRYLATKGAHLIDADQIAREVVMPGTRGLEKVADRFGPSVMGRDGSLDRAALRRMILADERAREELEAILHPEILALLKTRVKEASRSGCEVVVVEIPLLFELDMGGEFDTTVLVKASRETKVRRLTTRDRVSKADAQRLLNLQMADSDKEKRADIVIENNHTEAKLIKNVDQVHEMIYLLVSDRRQNHLTDI
jgi:dephospho-CoA kinase